MRRKQRHHRLTIALTAAGLAMALALAACADTDGKRANDSAAEEPHDRNAEAPQDAAVQGQGNNDRGAAVDQTGSDKPAQQTLTASADADPDVAGSAAEDDSDEARAAANGWLADPPKLLGIALGAREWNVRDLLGKPVDEYGIAEPEPLTILEYDGYSVGIGGNGRVRFVEVYGADVPTGLGSLTVGDTADDARDTLGEPASATAGVLLYGEDDVTLKIDLDPKTKKIIVIRLFNE